MPMYPSINPAHGRTRVPEEPQVRTRKEEQNRTVPQYYQTQRIKSAQTAARKETVNYES
jgi:hypothetical protein